ncbi:MAG: methyltransferase [Rhizobiales bacterium PAR1]|nr:MAG: methyltransferase [Rhizobiales bacterium PAR1]
MGTLPDGVTQDALYGGRLILRQPEKGHRAGTDAVLLAAAVQPESRRIADLGAATGAVGLGAALHNPEAGITLLEREPALASLARDNAVLNRMQARVVAREVDAFRLGAEPDLREAFDCVLSNPPFFDARAIRVSTTPGRASAHVLDGTLDDWVKNAVTILAPKGHLIVIHRADTLEALLAAFTLRLGEIRLRLIHPDAASPAIRVLVSGKKGSRAPLAILPPLVLHGADGGFLEEAAALHTGRARLDMKTGGKSAR